MRLLLVALTISLTGCATWENFKRGGGNDSPDFNPNSARTPAKQGSCTSSYGCKLGYVCVVEPYKTRGVCVEEGSQVR